MIYTTTENPNEYKLQPVSLKERLRLVWHYLRNPSKYQIRLTVNEGEQFIIKNCHHIMTETKNLVKVRE